MSNALPPAFEALEDLVDEWILPTEKARMRKRFGSNFDELKAYYDRLVPVLPDILAYLASVKPKEMSQADRSLLGLTLSLAEVSIAVEKVHATRNPAAYEAERLELVQEQA